MPLPTEPTPEILKIIDVALSSEIDAIEDTIENPYGYTTNTPLNLKEGN